VVDRPLVYRVVKTTRCRI